MLICRDRFVMPAAFAERQSSVALPALFTLHIKAYGALYTRVFLQLRDLFTDHGITRRKVRRAHYRYAHCRIILKRT